MRVRFLWDPRDLWIGAFIDQKRHRIYVMLFPTLGFVIDWGEDYGTWFGFYDEFLMQTGHLPASELMGIVLGQAIPVRHREHLDGCPNCQNLLAHYSVDRANGACAPPPPYGDIVPSQRERSGSAMTIVGRGDEYQTFADHPPRSQP